VVYTECLIFLERRQSPKIVRNWRQRRNCFDFDSEPLTDDLRLLYFSAIAIIIFLSLNCSISRASASPPIPFGSVQRNQWAVITIKNKVKMPKTKRNETRTTVEQPINPNRWCRRRYRYKMKNNIVKRGIHRKCKLNASEPTRTVVRCIFWPISKECFLIST